MQPESKSCFGIKLCLAHKRKKKPNCDDRNIFTTAQRFPNHWQDIILQGTFSGLNSTVENICRGMQHAAMLDRNLFWSNRYAVSAVQQL